MKIKKAVLSTLFILTILCGLNAKELESCRVLFISSYNPAFPTFNQQVRGLRSEFDGIGVSFDVEFLDSKRYPGSGYGDIFYKALSYKLDNNLPYDVVITADDNALKFFLAHREELFENIPLVYFGINNAETVEMLEGRPDAVGLIESVSMKETIELMISLFPESEEIVALSDDTVSGQADLKEFFRISADFPGYRFRAIALSELNWEELSEELRKLNRNSSVLLLSAYNDKNGDYRTFYESLALIKSDLKQPLFHLWMHGLGQGVMGGKLVNHYDHAAAAAEMALKIMDGEAPSELQPPVGVGNRYHFDYIELQRFGVSERKLPAGSIIINRPYSFYRENRQHVWAVILAVAVLLIFLAAAHININKRRKTEQQLWESENKYKSIFHKNPSVVMLYTPEDGAIVDANESALKYYGYNLETMLGMKVSDISLSDKKRIRSNIRNVLKNGSGVITACHRLCSGEVREVEIFTGALTAGGREYLYSTIYDITEKNEYFRQLENAISKVESALKIKDDFLANVSHELRTPLNGVMGMLTLLRSSAYNDTEKEWHRLAELATENLRVIIEDLLSFSGTNTGRANISRKFFLLDNLVSLVHGVFDQNIEDKGLELSIRKEYVSAYFFGDETRITQIISNLVSNAIKYSNMGRICCAFAQDGDDLRLSVSDQGVGIDERNLKRIFEPFIQLENPYTKEHRGMGLGLSIVRNIVDLLGGDIKINSAPGKGTEFIVTVRGSFSDTEGL